ncbi:MAG: thrombospondin type 3 repeat-containing protein [Candidatus Moranbacteria bacterium]|jgi:hypothetical protein|nr:thrombospondin type 3 repeat-containing protein [Candidatus Moranbacteria bacterium]
MKIFFLSLGLFLAGTVWASDDLNIGELKSAFRSRAEIEIPQIVVPTVVEAALEFENRIMNNVMVVEKDSQKLQPVLVLNKNVIAKNSLSASDSIESKNASVLTNDNLDDFLEYPASNNGNEQKVVINISATEDITTSALTFYLDEFVSLPRSIEIIAVIGGEEKIVLGKSKMNSRTINFPKTTAQEFKLSLNYIQPLRIRELSFNQENLNISQLSSFRFLAQPNKKYEVYFNADRYVRAYQGEMPNLSDSRDVLSIKKTVALSNDVYEKSDADKDGVADEVDNCVRVENSDQEDLNNNGQGDACDDFDRDGVINQNDNCRDLINRDQKDTDLDGVGDVCDEKENRILQNQKWLPLALILFVAAVVGMFFFKTIKAKE